MTITDWLAIYAAILSTVIFAWDVVRASPKVKTRLFFGLHPEKGSGVYVSVQNKSSQTIHLAAVNALFRSSHTSLLEKIKFLLRYRRLPTTAGWVHTSLKHYEISDECPTAIEPGNAHQVFLPSENIEAILKGATSRELMVSSQDMLWRDSYSNILIYPPHKEA